MVVHSLEEPQEPQEPQEEEEPQEDSLCLKNPCVSEAATVSETAERFFLSKQESEHQSGSWDSSVFQKKKNTRAVLQRTPERFFSEHQNGR